MHACGVATHLTFNFFTIVRNDLKPFWNIRAANAHLESAGPFVLCQTAQPFVPFSHVLEQYM